MEGRENRRIERKGENESEWMKTEDWRVERERREKDLEDGRGKGGEKAEETREKPEGGWENTKRMGGMADER